MADFAELMLEGVPVVAEHYDKVYDPLKDKTKQGIRKVKEMRQSRNSRGGGYESESEEYEYDGPPPRRTQTAGAGGYDSRRRSGRDLDSDDGFVTEERRHVHKGPTRAKSVGRDSRRSTRGGGKSRVSLFPHINSICHHTHRRLDLGSRRDYSDSESSISPRPRRERRKSLGEKALVALGLAGAGGAAASEKSSRDKSRSRRDRSLSSDYSSRRRDDRSYGAPPRSRGYPDDDDRTPSRYKPRGYVDDRDGSEPGSQVARRSTNTEVASRRGGGSEKGGDKKKGNNSSESSSDLCSSSEDERRTRKIKGKEYLTAGLAAVATIHAAHSVYSSMEARDKRHHEVATGEMKPEEAKRLKNKARFQDAAAIGIAALGIKGAYSEWQEVQENRHELAEQNKKRQERHEKRVQKGVGKYAGQSQSGRSGGGGGGGGGGRSKSEGPSRRDRDRDY